MSDRINLDFNLNSRIHFAEYLAANEERQLTRLEFVREVSSAYFVSVVYFDAVQ